MYDNNYKSCTWFDSTQSKQVSVGVNVCGCSENNLFNDGAQYGTAMPYAGVGDQATLATKSTNGQSYAEFTAVKARVGVDLTYQSTVDPSTVRNAMAADVSQILAQFQ